MYNLNDTIVAVSSPTSEQRVIIRITGSQTFSTICRIFTPQITNDKPALLTGRITIDADLQTDAKLYLFLAPNSYTGDDLAELHIYSNSPVTQSLIAGLLAKGLRTAGPGEFTARSYMNGKLDLAQAEAVNEIITSSNKLQLAAAEKLLAGRLTQTTEKIRSEILDCLALLEAGLDFSEENIEFITRPQAVRRLQQINTQLQQLLSGSIRYESMLDLPAVGIAGAPNAGKSSLLNKLLGRQRSIVSKERKTTRDVLTGLLTLKHSKCVIFDCAGLISKPENIIDELAHSAAIEALNNSSTVIFTVDVAKQDFSEDLSTYSLITHQPRPIAIATKSDLLTKDKLTKRLAELNKLFNNDFLPTSVINNTNIELLKQRIDDNIIELYTGKKRDTSHEPRDTSHAVILTARHTQTVNEALDNITDAINELKAENDEVTAMLLRSAHQTLSNIEQHPIDEKILDRIFSQFCIGK